MDKIKITSFRDEIATAILNSQDKLNSDKDAYIDEKELPNVLSFFGVDDVSKLLKTSSDDQPSIFDIIGNDESAETETNKDTVKISDTKDKDDALSTYGTAAYELNTKVKSDLSVGTAGNPYTQQIASLEKEKNSKISKGANFSDVMYKIDALNELVNDYLKEHPETEKDQLIVNKIYYGKDGKKEALMSQTFGITGSNAFNGNDSDDMIYDGEGENTEGQGEGEGDGQGNTRSEDSDKSNSASAVVTYNIDFRTLNDKNKGNWHIKGTINAGSVNSDLHGAFQYTKSFDNDSSLNFTGDLRETIKDKNNSGSYGAAVDYRLKKFSTGGYAMYYHKEVEGEKSQERYLEMYGKYGNTFIGSAGIKHYNDMDYRYLKGQLQGRRELPNSSLALNGGVGVEYGKYDNHVEGMDQKELTLKAKGGVSFKSKDLSADFFANATTSKTTTHYMDNEPTTSRTTTIGVLGNIETKNFDISTALSAMGVNETGFEEWEAADTKTTVTASIIIGIKNLFGKKVLPIIKYNVGNYDGASQNVGAGVIITP